MFRTRQKRSMCKESKQVQRKPLGKSDGFRRFKLALKRLSGREPRLKPDLKLPLQRLGGWWLYPELVRPDGVAYSFGVGEDIEFECAIIAARSINVFAFDPTPNSIKWLESQDLPAQFHFHPWAVADRDGHLFLYPRIKRDGSRSKVMYTMLTQPEASEDGIEVPARTVASIMAALGHQQVDVMKMDVEGAEYGILENLLNLPHPPSQLLIEFHHRFPALDVSLTVGAVAALRNAGYGLARISSSGREYTFIHTGSMGKPAECS